VAHAALCCTAYAFISGCIKLNIASLSLNPNTMQKFKIRCSAIGKIMTDPRSKSEPLSETTKTYCRTWLTEKVYDRRIDVTSKQMDKGNTMEGVAIDFAANIVEPGALWFKNEEKYEDGYMKGTPDLLTDTHVFDIKCPWSFATFPMFETELPNKEYYWQLQGYMALTGRQSAAILYVLTDAPEHILLDEARKLSYQRGLGGNTDETIEEVRHLLTYPDVADHLKFKRFDVARDDAAIEKIRERVTLCREYIATLMTKIERVV
jgi:hypothetical protein